MSERIGETYGRQDGYDVARWEIDEQAPSYARYPEGAAMITLTLHSANERQRHPTLIRLTDAAWREIAEHVIAVIEGREGGEA